jgi:hypothetical protein
MAEPSAPNSGRTKGSYESTVRRIDFLCDLPDQILRKSEAAFTFHG